MDFNRLRRNVLRMIFVRQSIFSLILVTIVTVSLVAMASSMESSDETSASKDLKNEKTVNEPFMVFVEVGVKAYRFASGGLWYYAASNPALQSIRDATKKASERGGRPIVTVSVCAMQSQDATIERFFSVCDEFVVVPFYIPSKNSPKQNELVWPNYDHPLINRLRDIRKLTGGKRLIGVVSVGPTQFVWGAGEWGKFKTEELVWQALALIGANCQGYSCSDRPDFRFLEKALEPYAIDLGEAHPIGWVSSTDTHPVSAIASDSKLFIILLNPNVMTVNSNKTVLCRAIDDTPQSGTVVIRLPAGIHIGKVVDLLGKEVKVTENDNKVMVDYQYNGGGGMIICDLARKVSDSDQEKEFVSADGTNVKNSQ